LKHQSKLQPMEKALILSRLQDTIDKLKELDPSKFNYSHFIDEYDADKGCGTVCCVAGWYPTWFPLAHLRYLVSFGEVELISELGDPVDIQSALISFHGLGSVLVRALFYGDADEAIGIEELSSDDMRSAELKDVIKRFEIAKQYVFTFY
jgi:hypothetical protein